MTEADLKSSPRVKRPLFIWFIVLLNLFNMLAASAEILQLILLFSSGLPLALIQNLEDSNLKLAIAVNIAISASLMALNLTTIAYLFLLKRQAVKLFAATAILNLTVNLWQIYKANRFHNFDIYSWVGLFIGVSLSVAAFLYIKSLDKKGVLK